MSLVKPLLSWYFFEDIIEFVKEYWNKRKCFYPGYFIVYPRLNQSLKWRYDYVIIVKNKHKKITENLLDRFYEALELFIKRKFDTYGYIVKIPQVKGSFYGLIRRPRGKILHENLKYMIDNINYISEKNYRRFARHSNRFRYNFFPYFKLVRCYGNYQYHFLVVRKYYQF